MKLGLGNIKLNMNGLTRWDMYALKAAQLLYGALYSAALGSEIDLDYLVPVCFGAVFYVNFGCDDIAAFICGKFKA